MNSYDLDLAVAVSISADDLLVGCENNNRAAWVAYQFRASDIVFFQDGLLSRYIAKEAINCFVNGQFIATVLLAFSLIERSIAGRLLEVGETNVREERSFERLLKRAYSKDWISEPELQDISKVCGEYRNSLTHIRTPTESDRHEVRAHDTGRELYEVIEEDARVVLAAAFNILGKTSI